jgi:hypothetical protein
MAENRNYQQMMIIRILTPRINLSFGKKTGFSSGSLYISFACKLLYAFCRQQFLPDIRQLAAERSFCCCKRDFPVLIGIYHDCPASASVPFSVLASYDIFSSEY